MATPAPHTLSAQLRRRLAQLRSRLLAHPLATSLGVALFALALRRLLSQLRRRLPTTTAGLPAPRFVLDAHEDFHAFVFSSDGTCIAHGREPSFVGKELQQVFANEEIEESAGMHERFLRAAAAGGGWCTYSWRTSAAVLRLKGAYIFGVDLGGGKHGYAGGIRGRPTPDASPNPSPSPTPTPTPDPDQVWATRCARPRRRGGRSACTASCATARAGASRAPPEPEP